MRPAGSEDARAAVEDETAASARLLDEVEAPAASASVTLASGRRYEIEAGDEADRLTVRARSGEVVLRIEVTDAGPVLSFSGASVDLVAARRIRLAAEQVAIEAGKDVAIDAGGSVRERFGGDRHARIAGDERVEAANVEVQASAGGVAVRARKRIALDAEHIGLNDEPLPQPFGWSTIADGEEPGGEG